MHVKMFENSKYIYTQLWKFTYDTYTSTTYFVKTIKVHKYDSVIVIYNSFNIVS